MKAQAAADQAERTIAAERARSIAANKLVEHEHRKQAAWSGLEEQMAIAREQFVTKLEFERQQCELAQQEALQAQVDQEQLRTEIGALTATSQRQEELIAAAEAERDQLLTENREMAKKLCDKMATSDCELGKLAEQVSDLKQERSSQQEEHVRFLQHTQSLQDNLSQCTQQRDEFSVQHKQLVAKLADVEKEKAVLCESEAKLQSQNRSLQAAVAQGELMRDSNETLKYELEKQVRKTEECRQVSEKMMAQRHTLEAEKAKLATKIQDYERTLEEAENWKHDRDELKLERQALEEEISTTRHLSSQLQAQQRQSRTERELLMHKIECLNEQVKMLARAEGSRSEICSDVTS